VKFQVVLEPSDEAGHTVYVPTLPGCISEGDTVDEAMRNIREAIELDLEPVEDDFVAGEHLLARELALWKCRACPTTRSSALCNGTDGSWFDSEAVTFDFRSALGMNC
jgi:predicted RNase H-like HicB family nuclease